MTPEFKNKIIEALRSYRETFVGTNAKAASSLGLNAGQFAILTRKGDPQNLIPEAKLITIARLLNVQGDETFIWHTAATPFFNELTRELTNCHANVSSRQLCDIPDIGKTHTALVYAQNNKDCIYVDCSQVKSRNLLVRFLAESFGVSSTGSYNDVYRDLVYYIRQLPKPPLIILDEAGDLYYEAELELKALWNAVEGFCAWFKIGADGLAKKFDRNIIAKKVGYAENHSRFGNSYKKITPDGADEAKEYKMAISAMIIKVNFPQGTDINKTIIAADFTLRNLKEERRMLSA